MTDLEKFEALRKKILLVRKQEEKYGAAMFLGIPDRWFEPGPQYRCINGHVRTMILKTDHGDRCLKCGGNCMMTFPEDKDDMPDELAGDSTPGIDK